MSKQWMKSALAAGVLVASTVGAANAEEESGFYIGGHTKYTDVFDADGTLRTDAPTPSAFEQFLIDLGLMAQPVGTSTELDTEYDRDFGYGASFGYKFSNPLRLELEYHVGENDIKGSNSSLEVESLMGNLWYDFRAGERLRPYVGGGLGMATMDLDGV